MKCKRLASNQPVKVITIDGQAHRLATRCDECDECFVPVITGETRLSDGDEVQCPRCDTVQYIVTATSAYGHDATYTR